MIGAALFEFPGKLVVVHARVLVVVGHAEQDHETIVVKLGGLKERITINLKWNLPNKGLTSKR